MEPYPHISHQLECCPSVSPESRFVGSDLSHSRMTGKPEEIVVPAKSGFRQVHLVVSENPVFRQQNNCCLRPEPNHAAGGNRRAQ